MPESSVDSYVSDTSPKSAISPDVSQASAAQANAPQQPMSSGMAAYEGKLVRSVNLPNAPERDRDHLIQLLAQKAGEPLDRDQVRDSIRTLYATGRFADIQAEVVPSGDGVTLTFATSANFFVGAATVDGAPSRPNANQILNAAKFQLGELYAREKLGRALENIRQLMQEDGYYRAQITAETTSNISTQQVDIRFHVKAGSQAHVGEVKVTGSSSLASAQVQDIAHLKPGDRVTAARVTDSLRRLRKKFQKQNRALAQVSIAQQEYRPETNAVDFAFQIDPGPVVAITAQGFHVSRGVIKKEVPVYEENAVDDDLLNEGKRNLLEYLQSKGRFDAKVDIEKQSDPQTMHVIYKIIAGAVHKLVLIEISGNKEFLDTAKLRSYLQIQPSSRFLSHGRYSGALLQGDVTTLENLYRSNGFRQVKIDTKVDDDFEGRENHLAVHLLIHEGPRTVVGAVHIAGNDLVEAKQLPELTTQPGQPYSEEDLASDRGRIISYYLNNGFPNATLDIATSAAAEPNREDVTFTIHEGERFTIDHVMLGGTDHTREYVVDREVQVKKGQPLSQQDLLDTQTRLYNLGIFSEVDTAVQNPEGADPLKNVLVQVEEAKRYTFTYGVGLEFETGLPSGANAQGQTGVSPRVGFDVTRLNVFGRDQSITLQSHVGRLQQRGLISYNIPKLLDNDKFKLAFTALYDNSLDVATFTSQRLEGKVELRQQFGNSGSEPGTRPGPNSITYRFDFRRVEAKDFATTFSAGEFQLFSLPARVGGPGFTFIHDRRDNPLESTKGDYFTLDALAAPGFFGTRSETTTQSTQTTTTTTTSTTSTNPLESLSTNFGRILAQHSTYYTFGRKSKPGHQYVLARSTTIGVQQPFKGTRVLPPGSCPLNPAGEPTCLDIATIPLPEQFFAGGGNSHRGFGLNQAGPRDPSSGFPIGGTAQFVNNLELRLPETSLPYLGEGFGFAIFHDMGNVFTAPHDMVKSLLRWHQPDPGLCLPSSTTATQCITQYDNTGYDYTSHAVGVGVRYKTPIGPLRFDFGYNLNPTRYFAEFTFPIPGTNPVQFTPPQVEQQRLRRFNVFFSIGQPF